MLPKFSVLSYRKVRSARKFAARSDAYRWVDPIGIAFTGNDLSLLPILCKVMVGSLVLAPGVGEAYSARDEDGFLVGFLVFSLPGQLMFLSYVTCICMKVHVH